MSKTTSSSLKAYRKTAHPTHKGGWQGWENAEVSDTLNGFDMTESRTPIIIVGGARVYDARGNGNGETAPTITGDHQDRITDYTAIVVQSNE